MFDVSDFSFVLVNEDFPILPIDLTTVRYYDIADWLDNLFIFLASDFFFTL